MNRKIYTYADYEKLPEGPAYQLIDGDLVMTPAPTPFHQAVLTRLTTLFFQFVEELNLGTVFCSPIDVYFSETETYQPDVVFVSKANAGIIGEKRIDGAPDLVVEILSSGTGYYDLTHKKAVYQALGVKEYWIIDPQERTIEVLENKDGEFCVVGTAGTARENRRVSSKLLNGFFVDVETLFRPIADQPGLRQS